MEIKKLTRSGGSHQTFTRYSHPLQGKKAVAFTIVTITIISLLFLTYGGYTLIQDRSSINKRINTLNNFVDSVEQDLPRQLFISGYRAIFLLDKKTIDSGAYITNVNASLNELFFNGTMASVPQDLMTDATFPSIENFLVGNADKINADIELLNPKISIKQKDPWNLEVTLDINIIIEDQGDLAKWNRSISVSSLIPVDNFLDPIYHVGTSSQVTNKVKKTPYANFVSGADTTNLTNHFQNSYYIASTSAPSFYNRLQGNFSADPNGIESLVNPQTLADQGVDAKYKTVVDYIYFSSQDPAKYTITGIGNLILDDENNHLAIYNASGIAVPV
jgi:hypothetical protein